MLRVDGKREGRGIDIVFENERVIVVDKPAGWLSVPSRQGLVDSRPVVGIRLAKERDLKLFPVHRLDVEVSGVLLFAKDAAAHRVANAWFEQRLAQKTYEAWTEGIAPAQWSAGQTWLWQARLLRGKKRAYESPLGKPAETQATFTGVGPPPERVLHWKLEPRTGRPHQLRWELYRHGFPILGDHLYGATLSFTEGAIALRAIALDLSACAEAGSLGLPTSFRVSPLSARSVASGFDAP